MDFAFFVVDWKMLNRLYMAMTMRSSWKAESYPGETFG